MEGKEERIRRKRGDYKDQGAALADDKKGP